MNKAIGWEYTPGKEREDFLKDNCETIESIGFMRRFTPEELIEKKDCLATIAISINDIQMEQKEANKRFKEELKPLEEEKAAILSDLKQKAEFINAPCYKFIDHVEGKVGYYDKDGELVTERAMKPEEHQLTVRFLTGTDN